MVYQNASLNTLFMPMAQFYLVAFQQSVSMLLQLTITITTQHYLEISCNSTKPHKSITILILTGMQTETILLPSL
jgi:hypothetical protein